LVNSGLQKVYLENVQKHIQEEQYQALSNINAFSFFFIY